MATAETLGFGFGDSVVCSKCFFYGASFAVGFDLALTTGIQSGIICHVVEGGGIRIFDFHRGADSFEHVAPLGLLGLLGLV